MQNSESINELQKHLTLWLGRRVRASGIHDGVSESFSLFLLMISHRNLRCLQDHVNKSLVLSQRFQIRLSSLIPRGFHPPAASIHLCVYRVAL
jgi:hypothetical protein